MAVGVIIAKDDFAIDGSSEELYVDPTTELLKVFKNVSGAFLTDGSTWSSKGDYQWEDKGKDGSNRRVFELVIPLPELDYVPQYFAYMDSKNNDKRLMLSTLAGGLGLEGDIVATASTTTFNGNGLYPSLILSMSFIIPNQLTVGEYGYYVQIYYDRAEERKV